MTKIRPVRIEGGVMVFPRCLPMTVSDVRDSIVLRSRRLPNGCWEWLLSLNQDGYGSYRHTTAHIVAYLAWVGEVPEGLELDHLCRNRACVNPGHLQPVTHEENMRRGTWSLRTHCPRGHLYDRSRTVRRSNGYKHQTRWCSQCDQESMAEYREKHREELRSYKQEWDARNPEKLKVYRERQAAKKKVKRDE